MTCTLLKVKHPIKCSAQIFWQDRVRFSLGCNPLVPGIYVHSVLCFYYWDRLCFHWHFANVSHSFLLMLLSLKRDQSITGSTSCSLSITTCPVGLSGRTRQLSSTYSLPSGHVQCVRCFHQHLAHSLSGSSLESHRVVKRFTVDQVGQSGLWVVVPSVVFAICFFLSCSSCTTHFWP